MTEFEYKMPGPIDFEYVVESDSWYVYSWSRAGDFPKCVFGWGRTLGAAFEQLAEKVADDEKYTWSELDGVLP